MGNIKGLGGLFLQNNRLTGKIPYELKNATLVHTVALENNGLTGEIPDWFGDMPYFVVTLQNNQLTGPIPDLSGMSFLNTLQLGGNSLTGCVADSLRSQIFSSYSSTPPYGQVGAPFCADGTLAAPAKPSGLTLDTESGSLGVGVDWDDVEGAVDYLVRWRPHSPGQKLNDGVRTTTSDTRITVADYGDWVVRVEACSDAGCGPQSTRQVVVEPQPNRAPVVNEDSEQHAAFVDAGWAPRGIYVSKVYEGIFSDPDGDTLTYSVSVPEDRSGLVDTVYIHEGTQRVFIRLDADGDWGAETPALADPLVTTVTLTATDSGGMSVSVAGEFRTLWQANRSATGAPSITGTARVGETLTASTSGITDADGLDNAVFSYQWLADDTDISGATSNTYTLAAAYEGKALKVRVSFTDDADNDESLTSTATAAVAPKPNSAASGQPSISGTARVGETLTASTSRISDGDGLTNATFSYQWQVDDAEISGATGNTYTLAVADEGKAVKVRVSFTDDAGNDESLTSAATASVAAALPPPAPTNLVVSDNRNGTLTLTWDAPDDDGVTGYQILRRRPNEGERTLLVYVADTGSTDTTWTDGDVTVGTRHVYRVKAINAAGLSGASNFDRATPTSPPENNAATGAPTITGTAQVGETLTAGTSGVSDADGLTNATFSYQWLADDADISGATSNTYTLVAADKGKAVKVRVSFTDDAGNDETLTSAATAAVEAATPPAVSSIKVDGATVTVTLDEDLGPVSSVGTLHLYWTISGTAVDQHPNRASVSGRTVTLEIGTPAVAGQTITVSYESSGHLKDADGNAVVSFSVTATNLTQ